MPGVVLEITLLTVSVPTDRRVAEVLLVSWPCTEDAGTFETPTIPVYQAPAIHSPVESRSVFETTI